jgi:chromosomal replication initiator protein
VVNSPSLIPLTTEPRHGNQAGQHGEASPLSLSFVRESGTTLWDVLCKAVADGQIDYSPIVLCGPGGCGKTTLIRRLVAHFRAHRPHGKTILASGDEFAREFASAVELDSLSDFRRKYRAADFWAVDGLEQLATKPAAQIELLHSLDSARTRATWVVVAARQPPLQIRGLPEALRGRLTRGLTVPMAQLACGLVPNHLPAAVLDLDLSSAAPRSVRDIIRCVARYFHLKPSELTGSSRRQRIVQARNMAIYFSRLITGISYGELGRQFGGRDHTTILHGFQRILVSLESDETTQEAARELAGQLAIG